MGEKADELKLALQANMAVVDATVVDLSTLGSQIGALQARFNEMARDVGLGGATEVAASESFVVLGRRALLVQDEFVATSQAVKIAQQALIDVRDDARSLPDGELTAAEHKAMVARAVSKGMPASDAAYVADATSNAREAARERHARRGHRPVQRRVAGRRAGIPALQPRHRRRRRERIRPRRCAGRER